VSTTQQTTTAEQLLQAQDLGRCELVQGELLLRTLTGFEHGCVVMRITTELYSFVKQNALGEVAGVRTGFQISHHPDTVRVCNIGFIRAQRVPTSVVKGFFQGPPDLAVEVLSPEDRAGKVMAKVQDWLRAGCRAVWVVDPDCQTVTIYDDQQRTATLTTSDELVGGDLVPGFRLPVAEIFKSS